MDKIVYSTALTSDTINAYTYYEFCKEKYPKGSIETNAAFVHFCNACERENKSPLIVAKALSK